MNTTAPRSLTEGLHEAADLIAAHPDLPDVYVTGGSWGYAEVTWQLTLKHRDDEAAQKATARQIVRAVGGKWDKVDLGETFLFRRQLSPNLRLEVSVDRSAVCERIVTGVKTVTIPAVAAKPERTEEREVVEWRCEPLLAEVSA